jgi:hypothetical protein
MTTRTATTTTMTTRSTLTTTTSTTSSSTKTKNDTSNTSKFLWQTRPVSEILCQSEKYGQLTSSITSKRLHTPWEEGWLRHINSYYSKPVGHWIRRGAGHRKGLSWLQWMLPVDCLADCIHKFLAGEPHSVTTTNISPASNLSNSLFNTCDSSERTHMNMKHDLPTVKNIQIVFLLSMLFNIF